MTRAEENAVMIKEVTKTIDTLAMNGGGNSFESIRRTIDTTVLVDIPKSLAVIADAMSERKDTVYVENVCTSEGLGLTFKKEA